MESNILEFIVAHPGAHLREIKRELNLAMGTVQYHLYRLEREGRIVSRRSGLRKRFYPSTLFGDDQRAILDVLSQETERDILLYVLENPNSTQKAVTEYLGISPGTVNWHVKRLCAAGLMEVVREGHLVKYSVKADRGEVLRLLKGYYPSIWSRWADRLADVLAEIGSREEDAEK
ncbi:MAG: winged helix-turn-helix transcriptional regulator [Anaerolineae bacterium]|jgi:predicted transcriptional regulator